MHVVLQALSWLWMLCMRSLYVFSVIMHDVDILILLCIYMYRSSRLIL